MNFVPTLAGFAWPALLLAAPLPWLVRWLLPGARISAATLRMPGAADVPAAPRRPTRARSAGRVHPLAWLAWLLLCIAAARPQQLGAPVTPPASGRDLMLALDLSGSMGEPDMELAGQPVERLTAAKAVLSDFLDRRLGDRVSLLVFGQRAYAVTPLTLDRESVREQLAGSVVGLVGQETAIGDALGLAVKRLRAQEAGQRVVILLTDGVNTAGTLTPERAAELARDAGVRVHTIAFGGTGELKVFGFALPLPGGGQDIDEAALRKIATRTGGQFFRARDSDELAGIYSEIDRLEPVKRPGRAVRPVIERYPVPLAAGLVAMLLLSLRRRGAR